VSPAAPVELAGFSAVSLRGVEIPLAQYRGKVVLVVNTASQCGFTPQYAGLEALHRKYQADGFEVLGFPCNQFGHQEPGDADAIEAGCRLNYGVSFPMFSKIEVKGAGADPLFRWLTSALPGLLGSRPVKWNFTKFLIDRQGRPVQRFAPITPPGRIEPAIQRLLAS